MFLKIVDTITEWLGPVLVLLGIGAWFAGRSGHPFPAAGAFPILGLVFCVLALLAAFEEKKKLNIIVTIVAIVVGGGFLAWQQFMAA